MRSSKTNDMREKQLSLILIDSRETAYSFFFGLLKEIEGLAFHMEWFSSPEQIATSPTNSKYDICLLSVGEKKYSIADLVRRIRQSAANVPVIVLDDNYNYNHDMETLMAGGADFLARDELSPLRLERSIRYAIKNFSETNPHIRYQNLVQNSERSFRTLIEQSPISIMFFSPDGKINFMNEASQKLFGVCLEEINNYNILEDRCLIEKGAMHYISRVFNGETVKIPAIKYHPAASKLPSNIPFDRWIHFFLYPVKDGKGNLSEVIVMHEDVTVSKESEEDALHHLKYLDAMERINAVSIRATSVDVMLKGVLDEMLSIFQCDRVWLLYPCDPEAKSWRIPMESCRPEWPGAEAAGIDIPTNDEAANVFRLALEKQGPVVFESNIKREIPVTSELFNIKAQIFMSVFPKKGSAWLLGIHHCDGDHIFSQEEIDIFNGIGHRVGEAITSFLAMQDLKESEERFRTLVENAPEAIVVYDFDANRYVDANENALNLFNISYKDLGKINPFNLGATVQPEEISSDQGVIKNIKKALQGKTPVFEMFMCDSEGNEIPCEIRFARLPSTGKQLIRGSITNISERKKSEESLRQLSLAVEQSPASIVITDVEGIIEYVNPKFTQVTGYSREEAIGRKANILKSGEHSNEFYTNLWQTITGGDEWRGEFLNRKKNGKLFWERASISPIVDTSGVIRNFLAVKEDITEKIKLENDAMRAAHLASLGELAAGVAHEINNPVNSLINFANILADRNRENPAELDMCSRMIKEGNRIASIVRNLLSFARKSEGKREPVNIAEVMADTLALCRMQLKMAHINLKTNLPENLPPIIANKNQLQQVFLNIIINAHYALNEKYSNNMKDKILEMSALKVNHKKQSFMKIVFHDNGTGIPKKIKEKILNPFFSTKPANKGTGLGLSISHGIIEEHHGKITFNSVEGEFTEVIIEFPLETEKRKHIEGKR